MWWRDAIYDSHQTLRMQKLWIIRNTARTDGAEGKTEAQSGVRGRRTGKTQKRIPEVVAQPQKIDSALFLLNGKLSKRHKRIKAFPAMAYPENFQNGSADGDNLRRQ
jgi:hypothetical protein